MRRQARPCNCSASKNRLCSSSVHFSRCFVIVYGFRAWSGRREIQNTQILRRMINDDVIYLGHVFVVPGHIHGAGVGRVVAMIHGVFSAHAIANGVFVTWHHFLPLRRTEEWEKTTNNQAQEPY
jgi:hypothetical protein